jgi:hypothetical protein
MKRTATASAQAAMESDASVSSDRSEAYVIGLVTIRTHTGVLWDRTRGHISERLKSILGRLAPPATFELSGPDLARCVVRFPSHGKWNADICVRTAYDLILGLMGQCNFSDIHISRLRRDDKGGEQHARLTLDEMASIVERAKLPELIVPREYSRKLSAAAKGPESKEFAVVPRHHQRSLSADYKFEPVWDAQAQVVCMYFCVAKNVVLKNDHDTRVPFEELTHKERSHLELEGALMGVERLLDCIEQDERFILNLPIGFETISSSSGRAKLTQLCRSVLPVYRPYLVFTLTDVPIGVSAARLSDFVTLLRPFGRVTAVLAKGERNYSLYQNIGLNGIAADVSVGSDSEMRSRGDIVNLAAAGRSFKFGTALYGVSDPEMIAYANSADIRLFHGPCIGEGLDAPRGMTHLARSAVLPEAESEATEELP